MNEIEMDDDEKVIEEIKPSKKLYIAWLIAWAVVSILSAFMLLPILILYAIYGWLRLKTDKFTITNERLIIQKGIISKRHEEIELYRIKDITMTQGFSDRFLNSGNLEIVSQDSSTPNLVFRGVDNPLVMKEKLRSMYRASRKKERVINTEMMMG